MFLPTDISKIDTSSPATTSGPSGSHSPAPPTDHVTGVNIKQEVKVEKVKVFLFWNGFRTF